MLNQICILLQNWEEAYNLSAYPDDTVLLIPVDSNENSLASLFKVLYTQQSVNFKSRFSLCFNFSETDAAMASENLSAILCNLVFHPLFYTRHTIPQLFYKINANAAKGNLNVFLNHIRELLKGQHYNNIQFYNVPSAVGLEEEKNRSLFIPAGTDFKNAGEKYLKSLLQKGMYNKHIYIQSTGSEGAALMYEELEKAEEVFASDNKMLFESLKQLSHVEKENASLHHQLQISNQSVKDYKQYLAIMHTQDEANRINEFYYQEYEVLPLWYKRFGHIIKVILGKRALHSLFNKNGGAHHNQNKSVKQESSEAQR